MIARSFFGQHSVAYAVAALVIFSSTLTTGGVVASIPNCAGSNQVLPGPSWEAEDGDISAPFVAQGGYIAQPVEALNPSDGGRASYTFAIAEAGEYVVKALLDAPNTGANSIFINVDAEPVSPAMIWDVEITTGFQERTAAWRGSGTPDDNEFVPRIFTLSSGEHELIVRGREPNTRLGRISVELLEPSVHMPLIHAPDKPSIYFVSKSGNNSDGRSWTTAWNELDQIDWSAIGPGDTILLDGGRTEMVYASTLTIEKSGTPDAPITIKLASRPGRDGRAVIFGGRSALLPYCGQTDYSFQTDGVRGVGIRFRDHEWVVIDGTEWRGITIYGHNRSGIQLPSASDNIIIRNVEIHDNGIAYQEGGAWYPDLSGVDLAGTNITFERTIIHDNGQDAFQSGGVVGNMKLKRSWLYNARAHPSEPSEPFNHCRHSDGVQIYGGGHQYGMMVEDSIIGPSFMQGFILGGHAHAEAIATIHDVTVRNTLIVGYHGESSNAGILTMYDPNAQYPNDPATNYLLDHVTIVRDPNQRWWSVFIHGSGHTVTNSIFQGGYSIRVDGSPRTSNNFRWQVQDAGRIAVEADPQFVDDEYNGVGDGFADFDFSLREGSAAAGAGSSIGSVAELLSVPEPTRARPTPFWKRFR